MLKNFFYVYILLFLVLSCQKDDPTPPDEEINLTVFVSVPQPGGVNLKANYTGLNQSEITESGFLISSQNVPNFNNSFLVEGIIINDQFENTINTDLVYNNNYFVRAYVKVGNTDVYYSDEQSFVSLGSTPPVINEVTKQAHLLDTITIYGNYFSNKTNNIKVLFGDESSRIIASNDTIIKCIVPETVKRFDPPIEVKVYEKKVANNSFSLFKPEITSISPLNATFREELTIIGEHFDFEKSRNKVYFGNIEATITYSNRNTLKILVPDDLESSSEQIKVIAQLQETTHNENFQLTPPQISFVTKDVYANQDIVIQGAYFHPIKDRNKIIFENADANIISGGTETLNTKIPYGPFPRRKAIVKVQLLDILVEYEIELNILDKWVMVSNELPFRFYRSLNNAVVANNNAYVIAPSKDISDEKYYLWKFNPNDFSWEQSTIPFSMKWSGVAEANNDKIFVYTAKSDNAFWEFDPLNQQWNQLDDYPGTRRDYATHFSLNGDVYIGMGADYEPYTSISNKDFYRFSPSNGNWVSIADFTGEYYNRTETSVFTIANIAYVGNGASNTGMVDFWSYLPNSNEWKRIADFPYASNYTAGFELNGYGFVTGAGYGIESWKYDPINNSWEQSYDIGKPRGGHFSFSLNGKAYIGGSGSPVGSFTSYELYEFKP